MKKLRFPDFKTAYINISNLYAKDINEYKKALSLFIKYGLTFINLADNRVQPMKVRLILLSSNTETTSIQIHFLRLFINKTVELIDKIDGLKVLLLNLLEAFHRIGRRKQVNRQVPPCNKKYLIIVHLFYEDLYSDFLQLIKKIDNRQFDLCITVPEDKSDLRQRVIHDGLADKVLSIKNLGRDIRPFIMALEEFDLNNYSCILKIHTKKSPHMPHGNEWRNELWSQLAGSQFAVDRVLEMFEKEPQLGMVGPRKFREKARMECNLFKYLKLCRKLRLRSCKLDYFSGSMFWIRPEALQKLIGLESRGIKFSSTDRIDGNLEHAIERIFGALCYSANLTVSDF